MKEKKNGRIKKYIEKWSGIKIIWNKTRVLKIIWKLKSRKLNLKIGILKNYMKMRVLKIKIENMNFGKLFENVSCENWIWKLEFWKIIWKWKFGKLEFWRIVWELDFLKNKFENWGLEK